MIQKKKDTDFTDEIGGGEDDVFIKDDFFRVLDRAISSPKPHEQETGGTSE
ncbi:MAG: hypothetical protein HON98_05870 [Chloroflexi bacterium]|nr:hypothetical protein [Chloroflexota bacterium]MBT3670554.1 hypothetical protein [Chloroflexota bacterium]MBT4002380.1 hypothetical protein [Chloroflexota bacterium]MBT4304189.1 hypothetical protein [Chloroflexota bacterium]MBT4533452.1 hypothetical protein [Chloroflexota bacterium]